MRYRRLSEAKIETRKAIEAAVADVVGELKKQRGLEDRLVRVSVNVTDRYNYSVYLESTEYPSWGKPFNRRMNIKNSAAIVDSGVLSVSETEKLVTKYMEVYRDALSDKKYREDLANGRNRARKVLEMADLNRRFEHIDDENAWGGYRLGDELNTNLKKIEDQVRENPLATGIRFEITEYGYVKANLNFRFRIREENYQEVLDQIQEILDKTN